MSVYTHAIVCVFVNPWENETKLGDKNNSHPTVIQKTRKSFVNMACHLFIAIATLESEQHKCKDTYIYRTVFA